MKFSLKSSPLGSIDRLVICGDDSELEILLGWGASLNAWRMITKEKKSLDLLYGYSDAEEFRRIQADTNAGACLSPFPGRTANAEWMWKSSKYKLTNNVSWAKHALHGFLNVLPWRFVSFESSEKEATLACEREWHGEHPGFPFAYRLRSYFTLCGNGFSVRSVVTNIGGEVMPYSQGYHPYFKLGKKVDSLSLKLPACKRSVLDSSDIPTGALEMEKRFAKNSPIGDAFINDCFMFDDLSKRAAILLSDPETGHSISLWEYVGENAWKGIQIYTPPNRESIALEPMTAEPDVLNHHRCLIEILPGNSIELLWGANFLR